MIVAPPGKGKTKRASKFNGFARFGAILDRIDRILSGFTCQSCLNPVNPVLLPEMKECELTYSGMEAYKRRVSIPIPRLAAIAVLLLFDSKPGGVTNV
jgi:hypothetical protein